MEATQKSRCLGRVVGLWRYPVKSMAAEALAEVEVSWHGLAGDRRWAFVRQGLTQSGFPWLTLREQAAMAHYRPSFSEPHRPDSSPTVVRTPSGCQFDVGDPQLADELWPEGVTLIRQSRGIFDTFPLSLISTQTVAQLGQTVGRTLDVQRFRPNLLIDTAAAGEPDLPFPEDSWVGSVLRIGGLRLRVDKRDGRCMVITIDPTTHEREPRILRTVAAERQGCLGVYGSTVEPGRVAMDDAVHLD
jgi:uncharacterized protein YcbX